MYFKELGDRETVVTNAVWVLTILVMHILMFYPCIKFESNQTIVYGDIAFQRFGGYRKCRHECSSSARSVNSKLSRSSSIT